jgi:hypothetical protein
MESTYGSSLATATTANREVATDRIGRILRTARSCRFIVRSGLIVAASALAACGTPPAKNFGGHWKPVNHFQAQPTEIPLVADYTYYAAPMDETLKTMLARWAKDSGRELSYQLPFDVTLYTPVSSIRTASIDDAAQQLTQIYAAQHVHVSATDQKILVLPSGAASLGSPHPKVASTAPTAAERAGAK